MNEVIIAGAVRTPVVSFNGSLSPLPAHYLGQAAIVAAGGQESMSRAPHCIHPRNRVVA